MECKKNNQVVTYKETGSLCFEKNTTHRNTICGEKAEVLGVKTHGSYSNDFVI